MTRLKSVGVLLAGALLAAGSPADARPLLEEVFPDGLPFPFERVLERLTELAGEDGVQTALIPLGRSLQRYAAAPDYFGSPRLVVAVTGDRSGGPEMPRYADRLYLGYQPAAAAVEAISFDEATGLYVFQEVGDYGAGGTGRIENADPEICLRCHQTAGPIFARPLWDETNANARVVSRLARLGDDFHGAPVRGSVDALNAFDAATDRAARVAAANRLWAEGCPDPACRAALFTDAIRYALDAPLAGDAAEAFRENATARWPDGLAVVSPDLPNRDPVALLAIADPDAIQEPTGRMDPETPRPALPAWRPGPDSYGAAVREVAALLTAQDALWIEERIASANTAAQEMRIPCPDQNIGPGGGAAEIRFSCTVDGTAIGGFVRPDRTGRVDVIAGGTTRRTRVRSEPERGTIRLRPASRMPRLPDGRRIARLVLLEDSLILVVLDDLPALDRAMAHGAQQNNPAFRSGQFRRRALLRLIGDAFGNSDG